MNWGDGSANAIVSTLLSPEFISHTYAAVITNYTVTITETNGCTVTGLAIMEEPANTSLQIPIGGATHTCAPDVLLFTNSSVDLSFNTTFVWNFADGFPVETYSDTNQGPRQVGSNRPRRISSF